MRAANEEGPLPSVPEMPQGEAFELAKDMLAPGPREIFAALPLAISPSALEKGVQALNEFGTGQLDRGNEEMAAKLAKETLESRQIQTTFKWPNGSVRMTRGYNGNFHFEVL